MTDQHKPPEGDRPPSEYFLDLALSRLAQGETPETAGVWLAGEFRDNGFPLETAIFCGAIGYVPRVCSQNPSATGSEKFYSRDVWEAAVRFEYSQRPQTELPATTAPVTPAASTLQAESAAIPGNALTPSAEFSGQKMEAALTGEAADPDPRQALIANLANIPEVLRRYAEKLQAEPGRWDFLTGPKSAIYKISHDGFRLAVSDGSDAQGIPVHSTRIVLVDRHGQIRGYYDATEPEAITKLLADTNHLLREQPK